MKKYLHIPVAIALILVGIWGCTVNRPRPLLTCFPTDDWTEVSADRMLPGEGSAGNIDITAEELKEAMEDISVRPRSRFRGWAYETIFMHITADTMTFSVKIGENGDISIAEPDDPDGTGTYWRAEDATLYEKLLAYSEN